MRTFDPLSSPLLTDLYQLTMLQGYFASGMNGVGFVRAVRAQDATYGIPAFGTMGHSFVQAHHDEAAAFLAFARTFPENAILLIDTYDTELAAHKVVEAARTLAREGITVRGVRLDSGDLLALSRSVRAILDAGGLSGAIIFASGNLDEHRIAALEREGAPIDAYGIGTALVTSADAPSLDMASHYCGRSCERVGDCGR